MVVGNEIAACHPLPDDVVDTFRGVAAFVGGLRRIVARLREVLRRMAAAHVRGVKAGLDPVLRVAGDETEVAGLCLRPCGRLGHVVLVAVQRQESFVGQFRVRDEDLVVGIGHDRIAERAVKLLDLGRRQMPVRHGGVTMEIRLVELPRGRQQVFFHRMVLLLRSGVPRRPYLTPSRRICQ